MMMPERFAARREITADGRMEAGWADAIMMQVSGSKRRRLCYVTVALDYLSFHVRSPYLGRYLILATVSCSHRPHLRVEKGL